MIEIWNGQTDLRPLAESWAKEWSGEYDIEQGMCDLTCLRESADSDVLIMYDGVSIVGAMGIQVLDMFFTKDAYSAVRYWYVLPEFKSKAKDLINYARKWSRDMVCTKMMICENKLSVPCANFYKSMGFREFETVYIGDL